MLMQKLVLAVEDYFDSRRSDPIALAYRLATLPEDTRVMLFETCVNYIREVAEREDVYSSEMTHCREVAREMIGPP